MADSTAATMVKMEDTTSGEERCNVDVSLMGRADSLLLSVGQLSVDAAAPNRGLDVNVREKSLHGRRKASFGGLELHPGEGRYKQTRDTPRINLAGRMKCVDVEDLAGRLSVIKDFARVAIQDGRDILRLAHVLHMYL
jgi:hypothetical protein